MKKSTILLTCALFSLMLNLSAQQYIRLDASFYSDALDEVKYVDIFLPADYYVNPDQQYATIYYLHGGGGNQNTGSMEALIYYTQHGQDSSITSPPAIFVCPDGSCPPYRGSCYLNSELYGNYEDFIMQDVISFVEKNFRAIPDRKFRFVTGESMGGFGLGWLAVNHPDMFRGSFPFAGFLAIPDTLLNTWRILAYQENGSYQLNYNAGTNTQLLFTMCGGLSPNMNIPPYYIEIPFDTLGNWVDTVLAKWYTFDASRKVKNLPGEDELAWFLGCGTIDYMCTYPGYLAFADSLKAYGIGYETRYFYGGHEFNAEAWQDGMHWFDSIINQSFNTLGISAPGLQQPDVRIFPNPVSDVVQLVYALDRPASTRVEINSATGSVVFNKKLGNRPSGTHSERLDIRHLAPGIYLIRLQAGNQVIVKRIAKL